MAPHLRVAGAAALVEDGAEAGDDIPRSCYFRDNLFLRADAGFALEGA